MEDSLSSLLGRHTARDQAPRKQDYQSIKHHSNGFGGQEMGYPEAAEATVRGKLGLKRISHIGSFCIIANTIAGPGIVVLPRVYQEAGWVIPTLIFILILVASSLSATILCDTMARIPGNSNFEKRIEFVNIFGEWWGKRGLLIAQVMFIINMFAQTISSIVANAQVMDGFIVFINPSNYTYAFEVYPSPGIVSWKPPNLDISGDGINCHVSTPEPFNDHHHARLIVSLGYVLLGVLLIPFSMMTLEENTLMQKISTFLLISLSLEFLFHFYSEGLGNHRVPAFGNDFSHVVGSIIFNYAFIATVPAWVNEKKPDVSINVTIWSSTIFSTILYISTGLMGACAYQHAQGNFLNMLSNQCSPASTRVSAFLFAFGIIGLGIPFNCICTRYSLLVGRACGPKASTFWAVFFPWLISWLFYGDGALGEIVSWSGDLDIGPLNFLLPLLVALTSLGVVGLTLNWRTLTIEPISEYSRTNDVTFKGSKHLRPAMSVASEADVDDLANDRTIVDPLPGDLIRFYRPIVTMISAVLCALMLLSIASHSNKYLKSDFPKMSIKI